MANFLAELKRRQIYRVAAAYAVVAWVLLQLVNNIAPALRIPDWGVSLVLMLLVVGFPVVLLFAWVHQLSSGDSAPARATTGKLDWLLIGALAVVISLVSYQQLVPSPGVRTAQQQASVTPTSIQSPPAGISVAVLPFANLSGDAAQEFFSDGMTEEIMTALAKVSALRIVGRESAFQFKDRKTDMKAVGQALGASYLVEGSVRKAGDQVRITAQLVQADDGVSVWTESYDRELKNIFATQSDIATAIVGALRVPLGLKQGDSLVSDRTTDLDSYQQYLRAKAARRAGGMSTPNMAALLEQVVARDPNFAPAWALLALTYIAMPLNHPASFSGVASDWRSVVDTYLPKAEAAAQKAVQLDANIADGHLALARVHVSRGKWVLAEDLYSKALALDANNTDALGLYSNVLAAVGRPKEALAMKQRMQALDPSAPLGSNTAEVLWLNGQNDATIAIFGALPSNDDYGRAFYLGFLAKIYAAMGRYGQAADALRGIPVGVYPPGMAEEAVRLLRTAPAAAASPQTLPRLGDLDFVFLHVGALDRALEYYESRVDAGYLSAINTGLLWHPSYAPVRKTERFKAFVHKAGLVEYWRAKGWPESCHPTTGDDFACD